MTSVCSNMVLAGSTMSASRAVSVRNCSTTTRKSSERKASSTVFVSGFCGRQDYRAPPRRMRSGGSRVSSMARPRRAVEIETRTAVVCRGG